MESEKVSFELKEDDRATCLVVSLRLSQNEVLVVGKVFSLRTAPMTTFIFVLGLEEQRLAVVEILNNGSVSCNSSLFVAGYEARSDGALQKLVEDLVEVSFSSSKTEDIEAAISKANRRSLGSNSKLSMRSTRRDRAGL